MVNIFSPMQKGDGYNFIPFMGQMGVPFYEGSWGGLQGKINKRTAKLITFANCPQWNSEEMGLSRSITTIKRKMAPHSSKKKNKQHPAGKKSRTRRQSQTPIQVSTTDAT